MLIHGLRLLREYRPRLGLMLAKIPGVTFVTGLSRAVGYYHLRTGPYAWPAGHYVVITASFIIATVCWMFGLTPYYRTHWYVGSPPLATRTGMLAIGMVPFLFSFALKLNPVTLLTGLSHAHLQFYHQWMAVLILFFSLVHAIPFLYQAEAQSGWAGLKYFWWSEPYTLWTGVVSFFIMLWMVASSLKVFRNMSYEFFVLQHIVCVFLFIGFMFAHVDTLLSSHLWLWATVGIWIFSVAGRGLLVLFSSNFFTGPRAKAQVRANVGQSTEDALGKRAQFVRLTVETPLRWSPGQHVYIRFPGVAPLQAHPFTCISLPDENPNMPNRLVLLARVHKGITRKIFDRCIRHGETNSGTSSPTLSNVEDTTATLDQLEKGDVYDNEKMSEDAMLDKHSMSLYALLDGPYGYVYSLGMYENNLLIAAGTGITFILPQLSALLRKSMQGKDVVTKRVRLIWSVQTMSIVHMVKQELMEIGRIVERVPFSVDFEIHATQVKGPVPKEAWSTFVQSTSGARLAMREIVKSEIDKAMDMNSSTMSVSVCATKNGVHTVANTVAEANAKLAVGKLGSLRDLRLVPELFSF